MRRKMPPAPPRARRASLALALPILLVLLAAAAAHAHMHDVTTLGRSVEHAAPRPLHPRGGGSSRGRNVRAAPAADLLREAERGWCRYGGRRHAAGARVATPEPCLRCRCARGALVCFLRVCPALPDPPPPRCLLHHASGACCPTLRCPEDGSPRRRLPGAGADDADDRDGGGAARLGDDSGTELTFPAPFGGCVHGGSLYAAGSAMSSASACEHCFCIGGRRRCVRPSCLPAPPGCEPDPAAPASSCCPARYRCTRPHHLTTHAPHDHTGCAVGGRLYAEGERVAGAAAGAAACDYCFCLRGLVRCLASTCAPPLLGCKPLLRDGECCPHSYDCGVPSLDDERDSFDFLGVTDNFLTSVKTEDRSFRGGLLDRSEPTTRLAVEPVSATVDSRRTTQLPKKRKTSTRKTQPSAASLSRKATTPNTKEDVRSEDITVPATTPEHNTRLDSASTTTPDDVSSPSTDVVSTAAVAPTTTTSQPDETMRIVINGTVNCTAELSTDHSPPSDDTEARTPNVDRVDELRTEAYTFDPNELITDRPTDASGDDLRVPQGEDTFMVNVSTLLRTNATAATLPPAAPIPAEIAALLNMSKKKDEYDYDYGDATLPPSLPNLKIIPFVAADAVVESAQAEPAPDLSYAPLEREDKFPVYFPSSTAEHAFDPTQFPAYGAAAETDYRRRLESLGSLFAALNGERTKAPHRIEDEYSLVTSHSKFDATEFPTDHVSKLSTPNPHFGGERHAGNLFSPPVETEGGFLPKEPPVLDDYYGASYPQPSSSHAYSPPAPPPPVDIAHHAPSINFDKHKECISAGGVRVAPGEALEADETSCARCVCTWGVLLCAEPTCPPAPPGCTLASPTRAHCCPVHCDDAVNGTTVTADEPSPVRSSTPAAAAPDWPAQSDALRTEPPPLDVASAPGPLVETAKDHFSNTSRNRIEPSTTLHPSVENSTKSVDSFTDSTESPPSSPPPSTTPLPAATSEANQNWNSTSPTSDDDESAGDYEESTEEEEEEEDGGFSFGSVLKLLLSDSYDSTTTAPYRHRTTSASTPPAPTWPPSPRTTTTSAPPSSTSLRPPASVRPTLGTADAESPTHLVLGTMSSIDRHTMPPRPISPQRSSTTHRPPAVNPTLDPEGAESPAHLVLGATSSIDRRPVPPRPLYPPRPSTSHRPPAVNPTLDPEGAESPAHLVLGAMSSIDRRPVPPRPLYPPRPSISHRPPAVNPTLDPEGAESPAHLVLGAMSSIDRHPVPPRPLYPPRSSTSLRPPAVRPTLVTPAPESPAHLVLGAISSIDRHQVTARPPAPATTTPAPPLTASGPRIEENLIGGAGGGFGGGMLKLAGCNIYGRMYRVGRIIAELSSACLQCMCTELGVQCAPLRC